MDKSATGEIILEYLEKWPDLNSLTLARLIYKDNPGAFSCIDAARTRIRYYRGNCGEKNRNDLADKRFVRTDGDLRRANPYMLPDSDARDYEPYIIPKSQNNILLLNDLHIPYHNIKACSVAIEYGLKKNINTVFLGGDFFDFYKLSKFEQDPRKRRFTEEVKIGSEFLDALRDAFPDAVFYFLVGNHEYRLERYLKLKAPELFGIDDFRLDIIFKFGELKINYIADKRIVKAGKLNILHGHEFGGGVFSPVNPARSVYLKSYDSAIVGHWHQASEHSERQLNGHLITCWSTGCLSELNPEYRPINKWCHGFGHIRLDGDGSYKVHNARIFEGKLL